MDFNTATALFITLAALFGYLNTKFIKIPTTIAIMSGSLLVSFFLITIDHLGFHDLNLYVTSSINQLDFHKILMDGMLSFLLFAGALNVDFQYLAQRKWEIISLASFSTIASTFLVSGVMYYVLPLLGLQISFMHCLMFGALISPTDPIAVLAIFKEVGAPKKLEISVAGESLFNDGVAIVIFLTLYQVAYAGVAPTFSAVGLLFLQQAIGGIAYGGLLGYVGYKLIQSIDDYKVEVLITIAMATGGYFFAEIINVSGPLAMVVAGIFLGNRGRRFSMSRQTQENLDNFWEMVDEVLNAVLFLLIGFELIVIELSQQQLVASLLAIPIVLLIRFVTVGIPIGVFKKFKTYEKHFVKILTWGGLRGGLAVALALSLPASPSRDLILAMTYMVVVFAVIVQGMTIKSLVQKS